MKHSLYRIFAPLILGCLCLFSACGQNPKHYTLTETSYFRVMSNMLLIPEQYLGSTIELDCFVYEITDAVTGEEYVCGVRKCSSGYGCTCGQDTIIGFILEYGGALPAAKNQSDDTSDKTWIHIDGALVDAQRCYINVWAFDAAGNPTDDTEQIYMYRFAVQSLTEIDGSGLQYYVTQ